MRAASIAAIWKRGRTSSRIIAFTRSQRLTIMRRGLEAGVILADSKGMLLDRVASLRKANIYERHIYRHFLGQPWIVSHDADEIRSETSFLRGADHARRHRRTFTPPASTSTRYKLNGTAATASRAGRGLRQLPLRHACWRCRYEPGVETIALTHRRSQRHRPGDRGEGSRRPICAQRGPSRCPGRGRARRSVILRGALRRRRQVPAFRRGLANKRRRILLYAGGRPGRLRISVTGQIEAAAGRATVAYVEAAIGLVRKGAVDAIVGCPHNETAVNAAGIAFSRLSRADRSA